MLCIMKPAVYRVYGSGTKLVKMIMKYEVVRMYTSLNMCILLCFVLAKGLYFIKKTIETKVR